MTRCKEKTQELADVTSHFKIDKKKRKKKHFDTTHNQKNICENVKPYNKRQKKGKLVYARYFNNKALP